jgi:hypothetical protein
MIKSASLDDQLNALSDWVYEIKNTFEQACKRKKDLRQRIEALRTKGWERTPCQRMDQALDRLCTTAPDTLQGVLAWLEEVLDLAETVELAEEDLQDFLDEQEEEEADDEE